MNELRVLRALWPTVRRHRRTVAVLLFVGALASLCEGFGVTLFIPLLYSLQPDAFGAETHRGLSAVLDSLFAGVPPDDRLVWILGAMLSLLVLKSVMVAADGLLFARLDARLLHELRCTIFERLLQVRLSFLDRGKAGDLVQTLESETWDASAAVAKLIGIGVRIVTVLVFACALVLISWRLTVVVGAVLVGISALVRWLSRRAESLSNEGVRAGQELSHRILEVLRAMRTVRAFGREPDERVRFERASTRASQAYQRVGSLQAMVLPLSELLVGALLIGVLFFTLRQPANLPLVLTFILVLYRLQPQVQRLDEARLSLMASSGSVYAVMRLLQGDLPRLAAGTRPCPALRESIVFDQVSYHYERDSVGALRRASLTIPARRTTAIVGPSGAGKTTLLHLLLRFDDPAAGRIEIDGVPLAELDVASWRARCAVVSQNVHLFHAPVADNIAYGRPGASRREIEEAARRAHAHDFIAALPRGYHTVVGDDGLSLSGGQRQRLALARALVRDPDVLILDEATNALDSIAESLVQQALAEISPGRTVIVVAHRFATLAGADHVVVLDEGVVCEEGPPDMLLASRGLFSRLHALQLGATASRTAPPEEPR